MFLQVLVLALLLPAVCAVVYFLALAIIGLRTECRQEARDASVTHRFAILIPAHNEATTLAALLQSCAELDFPRRSYQVIVVADHCTDQTASVARASGAICLERHGAARGKGQALAWAMPRILEEDVDAVVVVDADCRLEPGALRSFSRRLNQGDRVLQACYAVTNADASVVSYVAAVASHLENDLFYAPKSRLGLAVLLRGTGMVFHRDVLKQVPWQAGSIVEDAEYTARLYEAGWRVRFISEPCLTTAFPQHNSQLRVQRQRWIGGQARLALAQSWRLALRAVRCNQPLLLDLAWTMLVTLRTLAVAELLLVAGLSLLCTWLVPGSNSRALLAASAALLGCYLVYFGIGCWRLGLDSHRLRLLVRSPAALARVLGIAITATLPGRANSWARTPR